jgi:hypothetical protein
MIADALYKGTPNTSQTLQILQTVGGLGLIVAMVFARCLGLYDARLYDPDRDVGVHLGAKPMADWLCGDEVNWKTLNLKTYHPRRGRDYAEVLWCVRERSDMLWTSAGLAGVCPRYVRPRLQTLSHGLCEKRKALCEQHGSMHSMEPFWGR